MRQAIVTRYAGPTDARGSRVIASAQGGRVIVPWAHEHNAEENHRRACIALAFKLGWDEPASAWHGGGLPNGRGFAWVCVP